MTTATGRQYINPKAFTTHSKLLSGLSIQQRKLVLQAAQLRRFHAGSVMVNAGDPANMLFLLKSGRFKFYRITKKGDEVLLWWGAPGDTFGLSTLLISPAPAYIGSAAAIQDCELLVWPRKTIRRLAANIQVLAENALHIVLNYLTEYTDRLVGLISETAEQRLAHTLLHLGHRAGQVRPHGVELAITNEYLGGLANVSPFTASRYLKNWERQGVLHKRRGTITLLSPEQLLTD
jgi:CRP-like cAMP-binding protein